MIKFFNLISILFAFSIISNAQTSTFSQTFGSSDIEQVGGLQVNNSREIFITGTYGDDFSIGNKNLLANGLEDIFISKINTQNETVWAKSFGSNDRDEVIGFHLFEDSVLYFSGVFWDNIIFDSFSLSAIGSSLFITKLDTSGNTIWANQINGNGFKKINEGVTDQDGNYYITGLFSNNLYFPNDTLITQGTQDAFVAKYDKNGNYIWARRIGFQQQTIGTGLAVNGLGEVHIAGQFNGRVIFGNDTLWASALDYDLFFAKYDANGNLLFGKRFGGIYDDTNPKLSMGIFGKVAMAGTFIGLLNFDQSSIQTNVLDSDIFLAVFDGLGNLLSVNQYGDSGNETLQGLTVNIDDYYLSGYFNSFTKFGNTTLTTASGNLQNFVIRTSDIPSQSQPAVVSYPTSQFSSSNFVATYPNIFPNTEIAIFGTFEGAISLPIATPSPVSNGFTDMFLVGITVPPVSSSQIKKQLNLNIFPNPVTDFITIDFQDFKIQQPVKIDIINVLGQIQKTVFITNNLSQINLSELPKGIYYLRVKIDTHILVREILK